MATTNPTPADWDDTVQDRLEGEFSRTMDGTTTTEDSVADKLRAHRHFATEHARRNAAVRPVRYQQFRPV